MQMSKKKRSIKILPLLCCPDWQYVLVLCNARRPIHDLLLADEKWLFFRELEHPECLHVCILVHEGVMHATQNYRADFQF